MAQVIKRLLCKREALSSNLRLIKKKKKKLVNDRVGVGSPREKKQSQSQKDVANLSRIH
jgi:hypothetical protein